MYILGSVLDLKIEHRGVTPPSPLKGSSISVTIRKGTVTFCGVS